MYSSTLELKVENDDGQEVLLKIDLRIDKEIGDYRYGRNWAWTFDVNRIDAFIDGKPYNYSSEEARTWNKELEREIAERADSIISEVA
jgi:hypothetical protein